MARYIDAELLEAEVFTPHIYDINRDDVIALIAEQPTADVVEVKHAFRTLNVGHRSYCSNCGGLAVCEKYCSLCGAKMDGGGKNDL